MRDQRRADEARTGSAHRDAADGDDRQRRAQLPRRRFGVDRNKVGNNAADSEAGEEAQPEQLRQVGRIGRRKSQDAEQHVGDDQRRLTAIAVADEPHQLRTEQDADIACGQNRTKRMPRYAPGLHKMRCGKRDGADIIAVDDPDQDRPQQHLDLKRAETALVQNTRHMNFRLDGHFLSHMEVVAALVGSGWARRAQGRGLASQRKATFRRTSLLQGAALRGCSLGEVKRLGCDTDRQDRDFARNATGVAAYSAAATRGRPLRRGSAFVVSARFRMLAYIRRRQRLTIVSSSARIPEIAAAS